MELLRTEGVKKYYRTRTGIFGGQGRLKALDGVSISVERDRVFAIVGESGCGKSTLARIVLRLTKPSEGAVFYKGTDISGMKGEALKDFRKSVQVVFQDPFASLNPRMSIFSALTEPLIIHGFAPKREFRERAAALLETVGLKPEHMNRYPHEFSGGQRQRICIARALALSPELIVADEPLSSLDVSIQAQIINLLSDLKEKRKLSFIFISHDLNVVYYFADIVAVMYLGRIVEEAETEMIFRRPLHPYTEMLLEAIPKVRTRESVKRRKVSPPPEAGSTIEAGVLPVAGCPFLPRCPKALSVCREEAPPLKERGEGKVACHLY